MNIISLSWGLSNVKDKKTFELYFFVEFKHFLTHTNYVLPVNPSKYKSQTSIKHLKFTSVKMCGPCNQYIEFYLKISYYLFH
jgi:hypothetical protein